MSDITAITASRARRSAGAAGALRQKATGPLKLSAGQKKVIAQTAVKAAQVDESLPYAPKVGNWLNSTGLGAILARSDALVADARRKAIGADLAPDEEPPDRPTAVKFVEPTVKAPKTRSIIGQLADTVQSLPSGIVHLGGGVAKAAQGAAELPRDAVSALADAAHIPTVGVDTPLGRLGLQDAKHNALETEIKQVAAHPTDFKNYQNAVATSMRHYAPVVNELGQSFERTASDIRHPTNYAKAYKQGRIVGKVLEDAANASVVGGVAAHTLGAGAEAASAAAESADAAGNTTRASRLANVSGKLAKASDVTERVSKLGETAANAPAEVYTKSAQLLGKGARAVADLAPDGIGEALSRAKQSLTDEAIKAVPKLDPQVREARKMLSENRFNMAQEQTRIHDEAMVPVSKITAHNPELRTAATLVQQGMGPILAKLEETAPDHMDAIIQSAHEAMGRSDKYQFSPEAAHLAAGFEKGTLPAQDTAAIQSVMDLTSARDSAGQVTSETPAGRRTERYLAEQGGNPEQLGSEPMQRVIDKATAPIEKQITKANKALDTMKSIQKRAQNTTAMLGGPDEISALSGTRAVRAGEALQRATHANRAVEGQLGRIDRLQGKLTATSDEVANSREAMPARYRTTSKMAEDLATSAKGEIENLRAQGLSEAAIAPVAQVVDEFSNVTLNHMKELGIDPEHLVGGDFKTAAKGRGPDQGLLPKSGGKPGELRQRKTSMVPTDSLDQLRMEAYRVRDAAKRASAKMFVGHFGVTADSVLGADHGLTGSALAEQMSKAGYTPYETNQLWTTLPVNQVDAETHFIPTAIHKELTKYSYKEPNILMKGLKRVNQSWKTTVLPFSLHWNIGTAIGHVLNAHIGGGVDPISLGTKMLDGIKMLKGEDVTLNDGTVITPQDTARLRNTGLSHEVAANIGDWQMKASPVTRGLRKLVGNDDAITPGPITRLAQKSYAAHSFIDNMTRNALYLAKREGGLDHEAALKVGLDALGDYSNMSPFERNTVKEVLPFYPWMRQMTQLAFKLPLYHPLRVAWTLHLANVFGDDQSQLPGFAKGGIKLPNGSILPIGKLNPFGDVTGGGSLTSVTGIAKAMSPGIKLPVAALTGINLTRGVNQLTRPDGTGNLDESGRPTNTPLWHRPRELLGYTEGLSPMSSTLRDVIGGSVARYDTGAPYKISDGNGGEATIPTGNPLLRFLGYPAPISPADLQQSATTAAARVDKFRNPQDYATIHIQAPTSPAGIKRKQLEDAGMSKADADAVVKAEHLDAKNPAAAIISDQAQAARDKRDYPGMTPKQIAAQKALLAQLTDRAQYPGKTPAQIAVIKAQAELAAATAPVKTKVSKTHRVPLRKR